MKEMTPAGHDCHRKYLRACPIEHRGQGHSVVLLAMHDQGFEVRIRGYRRDLKATRGSTDQHQLLNVALAIQSGKRMRGDKSTKGKASQSNRALRRYSADYGQHVIQFATAFVVLAGAAAYTAKVKANGRPAALSKRTGQGLHHLVVQSATKKWMWVRNDSDAAWGHARVGSRCIDGHIDQAGGAIDLEFLGLGVHTDSLGA